MLEGLKEVMDRILQLGEEARKPGIFTVDGHDYTDKKITIIDQVLDPAPGTLSIRTLTGFVDYIKTGIDTGHYAEMFVHITSPSQVKLYTPLLKEAERHYLAQTDAILPENIRYGTYYDMEAFNIWLQSNFVRNEDCKLLLQVTGNVKEEGVKTVGDDGTSQAVVMKTGVAQVDNVKVPNPVTLIPWRTFQEIDQPSSKYVFRMQSGPKAALFEADGGTWRNVAIDRIKEYLQEQLKEVPGIHIIA